MAFKRKIYKDFLNWKENWASTRALLVQGARRIGKSTIVEEFAKNEYSSYILINFQSDLKKVKDLFDDISDLDTFFRSLSLIYGKKLIPHESIIIFDEVQLFPIARQSIKQLVADGRFHYIETGSLITLRQNVEKILLPSEERSINMYPMDFEEFLWAKGDEITIKLIKENFIQKRPLGDEVHRKIIKDFRLYMAIGGMPQAVAELLESNDYVRVDEIKRDILTLYSNDLKKLDATYNLSTSLILDAIPSELSSHSRLFKATVLGKNARVSRNYSSFKAIQDSMIVNIANNCTDPNFALNLNKDLGSQKIFMGDTGLLTTQIFMNSKLPIQDSIYKQLIVDKISLKLGIVFENVTAQILRSKGYDLYFHNFEHYEIDFMLSDGKKIIPIEVKSSAYKNHRSLDVFCKKYSGLISNPYVIYAKDLKYEDGVTFIPFYMAMFL
ncbi:MAG: ATP-binding protein [Treponema sp.]